MPTSITEYSGMTWLRAGASQFPAPQEPALAITLVSSGGSSASLSTIQFGAATRLVAISGASGLNVIFGTSLFSTVASTVTGQGSTATSSTSTQYLPGGTVHYRGVSPSMKILGFTS